MFNSDFRVFQTAPLGRFRTRRIAPGLLLKLAKVVQTFLEEEEQEEEEEEEKGEGYDLLVEHIRDFLRLSSDCEVVAAPVAP